MTHTTLPRDRAAHDRGGHVLILPVDIDPPVPLCCPTCTRAMASSEDEASFLAHGCCRMCELEWVQPDRGAWAAGRRPDPGQVEACAARRPPIASRLEVD
jgi:hypothetical protein